ncbi:hypothetical protein H6P81_003486 [Aristolochia fimbriata]|uniref:Uncharacterized protein n=1 Tax=Aristolochia fimbriata TaxID=158543 RepID=A0AAV7FCX0_ARIFI|nr:hypothetical protein H6P81_003486 [Aristolochia fimbriata]
METLPDIYPLSSLQIGDIQSYLSRIFLYFAPTSKRLYVLVDNRPWLMNKNRKTTILWQLMVIKYRMSPFINTRRLTQIPDSGRNTLVSQCLMSNSSAIKKLYKWFSVIDAAKWRRNTLFSVMDLCKSLHGFLVFEVAWKDVRGINYLSELQTDTSMALEVKSMKKWDFLSIDHALNCISLWFSGTPSETQVLSYNLKQLYRMNGHVGCTRDLCKELHFDKKLILEASEDTFFDVAEDISKVDNHLNDGELQQQEKVSVHPVEESCVSSTQYKDTLLLFRFSNGHLPFKLKKIITSDTRLLTLLESGLPSWVIFFQSYPIFCHLYRPWMRPLARTLYFLISLATVMIGFYDLYKNVPLLKSTASGLMGPLFDWIEAWEMISRIRYLGTMLFLHNLEKAVRWVMRIFRIMQPIVTLVTKPLKEPLMEVFDIMLPAWNFFSDTGELYLSTIWITLESSCCSVIDFLEVLFSPFGFLYEYMWITATTVYPLVCYIYTILLVPFQFALTLLSYATSIFSEVYELLKDACQSIVAVVQLTSLVNVKPSGHGVSIWKSISKDLFQQVFGATRSIINGLVAFLATCNRHRLSIYNHMQDYRYRIARLLNLSTYSCSCRQFEMIEYPHMVELNECNRCRLTYKLQTLSTTVYSVHSKEGNEICGRQVVRICYKEPFQIETVADLLKGVPLTVFRLSILKIETYSRPLQEHSLFQHFQAEEDETAMGATTLSLNDARDERKPLPYSTDEEEENDDDLFEIDIATVDKFARTQRQRFGSVTASRNVLLANCLLPVADVSIAVPSSLSPLALAKGDGVQWIRELRGLKGLLFHSNNTRQRTSFADSVLPSGFTLDRQSCYSLVLNTHENTFNV